MKVRLILPTSYDERGRLAKCRRATVAPLSLLHLAALAGPQHELSIVNECVEPVDFDDPVDLVGLSVTSVNARRAYEIAAGYRQQGVPVVAGGIHTTVCPDEVANHVDAVVVGEAEELWPQVLNDFSGDTNGRPKPARYSGPRPEDLSGLPQPRYDLIDRRRYLGVPFTRQVILPVQTSRGCPNNCDFCLVTRYWGRRLRFRPVEEVVAEIRASGGRYFFFTDDNFAADWQRTVALCEALAPLGIRYTCQLDTRVAKHPRLMELLADSGCMSAFIGFESLDRRKLATVHKPGCDPAEVFAEFKRWRIPIYASFIFGFEGDGPDTVRQPVEFLIRQKTPLAAFFGLSPIPGTKLYEQLLADDRLVHPQFWLQPDFEAYFVRIKYAPEEWSGASLAAMATRRFYSSFSSMRRMFPVRPNQLLGMRLNLDKRAKIRRSVFNFM